MNSRTLSQLAIQALRYSQNRDNHLAPFTAISNIKEVLEFIKETDLEQAFYLIDKLRDEIDWDLKTYDREKKDEWLRFYVELGNIKIQMERGYKND